MDDRAEALTTRFFVEAREFLARSKELLAGQIAGRFEDDDIHELFRCIHSLKSEAAHVKLEEIAAISHSLEGILEAARTGSAGSEELENAREILDMLDQTVRSAENREVMAARDPQPIFTVFEKKLLAEARRNSEQFYRVRCDLDPETPMKQARAYLILSNLEQIAGVVRMEPSIRTKNDESFATVTVYLTATTDESEIYKALDIDQVLRSTVEPAAYPDIPLPLGDTPGGRDTSARASYPEPPSYYRLGSRKLNQMTAYADELKITLRELDLDLSVEEMDHTVRGRITRLAHLSTGLFNELRATRTATLSEEFERLGGIVSDLSDQLGKKIEFSSTGGDIEVDRRNLLALSDPLTHLVRNAVDHGIEISERRESSGKPAGGHITVTGADEGKNVRISVIDDGAGIDEDKILAELENSDTNSTILEVLSRPGFSTLESATDVSGRGVGLDLVAQRIESIGGEVTLKTAKGKGSSFVVLVPKGATYSQLLFYRLGKELYALSNHTVAEIKTIGKGDLKRSVSGHIFYQGKRAFYGGAIATVSGSRGFGSYALIVSYLGKTACFLADDVLFEHDVQKELLEKGANSLKTRLAVRFGSGKREFFYLAPSLVQSMSD